MDRENLIWYIRVIKVLRLDIRIRRLLSVGMEA